jgi:ABC-type lipopolysaccharide export system ATPase subunit
MTAALSVRGLVAGYGGVPVVRDIVLDIEPDTFLAVVGANGAGKTTTLRAIMGLCDVFEGTVELGGKSLAGARTSDRVLAGLALCPEGRQVFPSLTVEENLLTGAIAGQGWGGRADALDRVYELLPRLGERSTQAAGTMSGGEQKQLTEGRGMKSDQRGATHDRQHDGTEAAAGQPGHLVGHHVASRDLVPGHPDEDARGEPGDEGDRERDRPAAAPLLAGVVADQVA